VLLTSLSTSPVDRSNPFIVMYTQCVWAVAVILSPAWSTAVILVSLAGFGWLVVGHLQAGLIEHHRLNDFRTHC
jgi:hypothetical protein